MQFVLAANALLCLGVITFTEASLQTMATSLHSLPNHTFNMPQRNQ